MQVCPTFTRKRRELERRLARKFCRKKGICWRGFPGAGHWFCRRQVERNVLDGRNIVCIEGRNCQQEGLINQSRTGDCECDCPERINQVPGFPLASNHRRAENEKIQRRTEAKKNSRWWHRRRTRGGSEKKRPGKRAANWPDRA